MRIYNYDHNGVFIGASTADESPLEPGVFLIPAYATSVAPPEIGDGERAVFDITAQSWEMQPVPAVVTPEQPEQPVQGMPTVVTMRQARLALLQAGLLSQVDASIESLPADAREAARIEWEYAATVERNSALVTNLSTVLGLSGEQLNEMFTAASSL